VIGWQVIISDVTMNSADALEEILPDLDSNLTRRTPYMKTLTTANNAI